MSSHLAPLLNHARQHIPPSQESNTPIFLLATAGMRLLPLESQKALQKEACYFLRHHSHFRLDEPNETGPCGDSVRVISGEEEGVFGWIAVNYLMGGFVGSPLTESAHDGKTFGFLDMGGASAQIAFEPEHFKDDDKNLYDVRLRLVGGREVAHKVFTTTWLGFGSNQARARYVSRVIADHLEHNAGSVISDPCLPRNLRLTANMGLASVEDKVDIVGAGSFSECLTSTLPTLEKSAPCPIHPHSCPFGGTPVPPISFAKSHFVGVSEYWYSSAQAFGLGGEWNYAKFEEHAKRWCSRDWNDIEREIRTRFQTATGVSSDTMDKEIAQELAHVEMQCFKSAWVANVLHEGLGMPRMVDIQEDPSLKNEAIRKKPLFQSVDTVGDMAISWTLGKVILEASRDVPDRPPPKHHTPPHPTPHAPTSEPVPRVPVTSSSFNSTLVFLYLCALIVVIVLAWKIRRSLRAVWVRTVKRFPFAHPSSPSYNRLEQGLSLRSKASELPPIDTQWNSVPRVTSFPRAGVGIAETFASPRQSPIRSASLPSGVPTLLNAQIEAFTSSRPSTPSPNFPVPSPYSDGNGTLVPRSRNASSVNLAMSYHS